MAYYKSKEPGRYREDIGPGSFMIYFFIPISNIYDKECAV